MEHEQIERINELARKKKTVGLTPLELEEQAALRAQYLKEFRENMEDTLRRAAGRTKRTNEKAPPSGREGGARFWRQGRSRGRSIRTHPSSLPVSVKPIER